MSNNEEDFNNVQANPESRTSLAPLKKLSKGVVSHDRIQGRSGASNLFAIFSTIRQLFVRLEYSKFRHGLDHFNICRLTLRKMEKITVVFE